ncbi:KilA N-domain protein [Acanthamoeba polyphaga moumouvirus]|uniref:KilA N-domain protein n=1 Tax=Acanthamoeba polyphaga moumouvirus TaxID=1269028 RepID=L7RB34_9VIRU|nr:KilA N-domain protein [Acanthamoeba polyphaga moumouvirus]AGC01619.1 KilA N-domain protein [Acanthamoeba polyphaga moumouvirus]
MKGEYMTRGTYVHPELIIHVACWCSIEYALKVSKIMIQYHAKEEIEKREILLKKKDDKIDKLSKKLDTLIVNNKKLLCNNKELLQKNEKMDNRIKRLVKKNDEIYNINQDMLGKIDVISNDRVVKGKTSDNHMFVIVKNNDDPDEYEDDEELYEYSAFRLMKKSYKIRMSEHLERHPNMEIILKICHSPNSMNLWNRIKTKLGKKKITYSGCNFNLEDNYTENKLVRDIKKIHNERLDTDDI